MGGFGALRIALRNPDTFSAVYAMSPCCLDSEYVALRVIPEGDSLRLVPEIARHWRNDPMAMVPMSAAALRRLAIHFDAGAQDGFPDIPANVMKLDSMLTAMGIVHHAEVYQGGHGDRVRNRVVGKMLPFFSRAFSRTR